MLLSFQIPHGFFFMRNHRRETNHIDEKYTCSGKVTFSFLEYKKKQIHWENSLVLLDVGYRFSRLYPQNKLKKVIST